MIYSQVLKHDLPQPTYIYPNRWHLHKRGIKWVENCLNCQAQRMVNSGTKFSWCLVTIDVSQAYIGFMLLVLMQMEYSLRNLLIYGGWFTASQGLDTMEQCPGRSLVTEQGTLQHKCFYVTLQHKLLGWFSEGLSVPIPTTLETGTQAPFLSYFVFRL